MAEFRALLTPRLIKLLCIGIALAVLQQWSGINVIFNYAEDIYRGAGYGISGILFNIVITGTINLVFTSLALGLVDRVGRRALMLFGAAGIGISHLLLGFTYRAGVKGLPILLADLVHDWILCVVAGAGDLGVDFGVVSEPGARVGRIDCGFGVVDRVVCTDVYVSDFVAGAGVGGDVLDVRGDLRRRDLFLWRWRCRRRGGRRWRRLSGSWREANLPAQRPP